MSIVALTAGLSAIGQCLPDEVRATAAAGLASCACGTCVACIGVVETRVASCRDKAVNLTV